MRFTRTTRHDLRSRALWAGVDASAWCVAVLVTAWMRYDFSLPPHLVPAVARLAAVAVLAQLVVGRLVGPYVAGHERGSFDEVVDIGKTVLAVASGLFAWLLLTHPVMLSRSLPLTAGATALLGMYAVRFSLRSWRARRSGSGPQARPVIVFGAGKAGRLLLRNMAAQGGGDLRPVALLDDDRRKQRLRVEGIRVSGTREAMADVAERTGAAALVVALPNADAATLRDLAGRAAYAGLDVLVLPPLRDIIGLQPTTGDLRDVDLPDLLGRRPIALDTAVVASQLSGARVLVTGAGGSIGSELCRQIARLAPARLFLLDRDESGLQQTELSLTGRGLLDSGDVVLADIRDLAGLRRALRDTRPDVVFHAAALKHLPLLQQYPLEAWQTNVVGTLNVLTAAAEVGVGTFVNVSTDKAARPICALGYSKRLAERLTAGFAAEQPGRYVSVRFGNVLGSRGSVIHAFRSQIEAGGPLTITHPDVERYFMLIPEACQLVLEAAAIGDDGEVLVLDMGEQVRIVDVAQTLVKLSGRHDVSVVYTGLRPGEKLCEELFGDDEQRRQTSSPLVTSVAVPVLAGGTVRAAQLADHEEALAWMRRESTDATVPAPPKTVLSDCARTGAGTFSPTTSDTRSSILSATPSAADPQELPC